MSGQKIAPVWELFRVPYRTELEVESGQLAIDKEWCWVPLNLALHFNAWSDLYYQHVYGDKETFHFAWRHLDQRYATPEGRPGIVHCHWDTPAGPKRMTAALEQQDFDGHTVFHHRTGAEWTLYGENPSTGRPDLDEICNRALVELRALWDGRVARASPPGANRGGASPTVPGRYLYRRVGVEEQVVDLEVDGQVGAGTTEHERTWRLEPQADGESLVIAGEEGDTCVLVLDHDGAWRGRCLWYQRVPVELIPLATVTRR